MEMKAILSLVLMVTVVTSAAPSWLSDEIIRAIHTRQIDPVEYAATMAQNGKLPVAAVESKADYPAKGTPEYEAMMRARTEAEATAVVAADSETSRSNPSEYARTMYRTEEEKKAIEVLAKAYTELMARSQQQAEARIDPKADPVAYAAMMAEQQKRARAEIDPVEYVRNMYRAEAEQRTKYEAASRSRVADSPADAAYYAAMMQQQQAQARNDPKDDPAYYAAMMQQAQARTNPEDDPAYYAAMMQYRSEPEGDLAKSDPAYYAAMMARTGQSSEVGNRFLLQSNFTLNQLISVVQTVVQGEINKTLNAFDQLRKNLNSLIGQRQAIQTIPVVILRNQPSQLSSNQFEEVFSAASPRPSFGRPKPFYPFYYAYPSNSF